MIKKSIELKEYKRSDGEKYYPVASFSKSVYLVGRALIVGAIGIYILHWVTKVVQLLVDTLVSILVSLNDVNGTDDLGLKEMFKELLNAFFQII